MDELFTKILNIAVVLVTLVVIMLVAITSLTPSKTTEQVIALAGDPLILVYDNIPCMINCYTKLEGEELAVLSQAPFSNIDNSDVLIDWFPCNSEIMTIAVLVNELVRWNYNTTSNTYYRNIINASAGEKSFFYQVKQMLYDCINNPLSNNKCTDSQKYNFLNFCVQDDYLSNYNYLPCGSTKSFNDYLSKSYFSYLNRRGRDIDNDFICDNSIGVAYSKGYSLCSSDEESKYDEEDCVPSWLVLTRQELSGNTRGLSKGRCEDFALLYYSLFRSIGVPAADMYLELNDCQLPCSCQQLLNDYMTNCDYVDYSQDFCYANAQLNFVSDGKTTVSSIAGCQAGYTRNLPSSEMANFTIVVKDKLPNGDFRVFYWVVNQNFAGATRFAPAKYYLSLDNDYGDDYKTTTLSGSTYVSNNILTLNATTSPCGVGYVNRTLQKTTLTADQFKAALNIEARFGFNIAINSMTNCDNDTVKFYIGFEGSTPTGYTIVKGDNRPVRHVGLITGVPYFSFDNTNTACKVGYTITGSGLIIQDVCYPYYLFSKTKDYLIAQCAAFITNGYYYDELSPEVKTPVTLNQFFSSFGCS